MEGHYTELMPIIHQTVTRYYCEELGVLPVDNIIPIEVSYDGTYAKRGFRSLHAMGYLVEVYTGYIIDMLVIGKCSVCPREARGMQVCPHGNYIGSSGGMEVQIAKILWGRSRDLGFEYKVMVADGDASTYNAIKDTYGRSSVVKEMCANHVGKRMKTRLLKLASTFTQNTTFMSGEEGDKRLLVQVPESSGSWRGPVQSYPGAWDFLHLSLDARKEVEKIYSDLSDVTLLEKCQKGHTQNANESLHSKLWSKVAKHEYHGHERIVFLGRVTTLDHNLGSEEGSWLRSLGVGTSDQCLRVLRFQDSESVRVASRNPRPRQQSEEAEDAGPESAAASPPGLARFPALSPGRADTARFRRVLCATVPPLRVSPDVTPIRVPATTVPLFSAPSAMVAPPLIHRVSPAMLPPESVPSLPFLGRGRHFSFSSPGTQGLSARQGGTQDPRPARHGTPAPGLARQGGTLDPRPARQPASAPCPAPQHPPRPSTSRNEDPSARPPIPYSVLMGENSESSSEDAVRESENSEDSFVLCLSSDEGEGDEVTSASTSDIPVAPILPHNPRPGPKIEMRHSLVKE
ncbi:hypothetical protein C7M84_009244 [Penaeus vannamei]|uniref:Mutator-like transposase domain-containing protein n=1 Tax=Penaeus vannamei TaxID=6689 RepID=A0A3R7SRY6_PENVA|nr:hypothetical protein C7M84_009244 [Penaeus vannamei]